MMNYAYLNVKHFFYTNFIKYSTRLELKKTK